MRDWLGDRLLLILTLGASLAAVAVMVAIIYKVVDASRLAFGKFGISFLWGTVWDANPAKNIFGAGTLIYGTVVTSIMALALAIPPALTIALFLTSRALSAV